MQTATGGTLWLYAVKGSDGNPPTDTFGGEAPKEPSDAFTLRHYGRHRLVGRQIRATNRGPPENPTTTG